MKFRLFRKWFSFRYYRLYHWAIGADCVGTAVPEGISFSLYLYRWQISIAIVFGEWE